MIKFHEKLLEKELIFHEDGTAENGDGKIYDSVKIATHVMLPEYIAPDGKKYIVYPVEDESINLNWYAEKGNVSAVYYCDIFVENVSVSTNNGLFGINGEILRATKEIHRNPNEVAIKHYSKIKEMFKICKAVLRKY